MAVTKGSNNDRERKKSADLPSSGGNKQRRRRVSSEALAHLVMQPSNDYNVLYYFFRGPPAGHLEKCARLLLRRTGYNTNALPRLAPPPPRQRAALKPVASAGGRSKPRKKTHKRRICADAAAGGGYARKFINTDALCRYPSQSSPCPR
jgi:hypothetical protein